LSTSPADSPTEVDRLVLHPHNPTRHIYHKANTIGSEHAAKDHAFLQAVVESVADAGAAGPASAKTELVKHIHRHDPKNDEYYCGSATVDHPTMERLSPMPKDISKQPIGCTRK
jgi:hypothetical protein